VTATFELDRRVGDREAGLQLAYDLFQLTALLWLGFLATGLSFALLFKYQPLPWEPVGSFNLPFVFRVGVWMAIMVGSAFTSLYAWRVTRESRRMSDALAATEAVLAHEQKLSALGGMAAAAAHELGTPLATIQVTAKEMTRELDPNTPLGEDAALMLSQAQRCRDILEQLSLRGDEGDEIHDSLSLEDLLEEAAEPYITFGKDISNGIWQAGKLVVTIGDDGEGFDPTIKGRLGQPYVSKRQSPKQVDELAGGLGLGVFIATTLIERTSGKVSFGRSHLGGAQIRIVWSRKNAEIFI